MPTVRKIANPDTPTADDWVAASGQNVALQAVAEADDLPAGWVWSTVQQIAENIQYGYTQSATSDPVGPKFLRITDIQDGQVDWNTVPFCACSDDEHERYRLQTNDIVFARTGATTGKSYLIKSCPDAIFASYLIRLRLKPVIDARFLAAFLDSPAYWSQIMIVRKGSAQPGVNASILATLKLPLPPLAEQGRIVEAIEQQLTRLDAGVASLKAAQARLRRYKAAVLKAACEGRLVAQEPDDEPADELLCRILDERRAKWEAEQIAKMQAQGRMILDDGWRAKYQEPNGSDMAGLPELPEGWVWSRVDQIADVRLGRQRSPKNHYGPHMRPYIRAANVTWRGIDISDILEMNFNPDELEIYRLHRGDILLSEASGSPNEVGKPAIWNNEIPDCCFQNTIIRIRAPDQLVAFLHLHFLNDALTGRFGQIAKGIGIHHLGADRLSEMPVKIAPLAEQQRIVAEVERRLSVVAEIEAAVAANLKRAERLRQAILKRAFEGKLVPQDPSDEPASVLLERIRKEREVGKQGARQIRMEL